MTQKTQCQQVLDWLKREPITAMQALAHLSCFRLAARVHELKDSGHKINKRMVEVYDRHGAVRYIAQYWMA